MSSFRYLLTATFGFLGTSAAIAQRPALLPLPQTVTVAQGHLTLSARTTIDVPPGDTGARNAADRLREWLGKTDGFSPAVSAHGSIRFERASGMPPEGYRLVVTPSGATISASDDAGLLHGAVTLWQLAERTPRGAEVPAVTITDAPRFPWRGLMLDSARHFQSPAFVHRLIDAMAVNKLNMLHWHLVDDQGWRIEIKKYPRLTNIAGWRLPATAAGAPALPRTGGFYTQAQIREIVAYAQARGITIVPEIEMPGHALSAIRAYPKLGMGVPIPPGTESDWGVFPWLYNTDDATFGFLQDVLDETMALFPSRYIHLGGDEAVKDQWQASPAIQARMKMLGITSEDKLQGWFVSRIGQYLETHGRKLIGWDEILGGDIPADATVMSWRGIDGAVAAAKAGHDTILSPMPALYLDNRQGVDAAEGPGRGNFIALSTVYAFDPAPASIPVEAQRHILGLQGNLWTEHVRGEARAAQMAFPRASAIAELGWSATSTHDYRDFVRRLSPQIARMKALGIEGSSAVFRPVVTLATDGAKVRVTLAGQTDLPVRYTLDGSAPTVKSTLYTAPLSTTPARLRAVTFLDGVAQPGAIDRMLTSASARYRDDTQLALCDTAIALRLEDDFPAKGPRAAFATNIEHPCWRYDAAPMDGVRAVAVEVGQLPFNFQIGKDIDHITFRPPASPAGEVEIRDGCDGPRVAVLPLAPASTNPGVTRLTASFPAMTGSHDLCFTYTAKGPSPMWALRGVQLVTAP